MASSLWPVVRGVDWLSPDAEASERMITTWSNKPDAVNPAMSLRLTVGYQRRRVADLER
jgi:hypothetical protein